MSKIEINACNQTLMLVISELDFNTLSCVLQRGSRPVRFMPKTGKQNMQKCIHGCLCILVNKTKTPNDKMSSAVKWTETCIFVCIVHFLNMLYFSFSSLSFCIILLAECCLLCTAWLTSDNLSCLLKSVCSSRVKRTGYPRSALNVIFSC